MADDLIPRADALGKRVSGHPEHQREEVPALIAMLWQAGSADELVAVVEALGKAWSDASSLALLSLADHPDADVRFAVACSPAMSPRTCVTGRCSGWGRSWTSTPRRFVGCCGSACGTRTSTCGWRRCGAWRGGLEA